MKEYNYLLYPAMKSVFLSKVKSEEPIHSLFNNHPRLKYLLLVSI